MQAAARARPGIDITVHFDLVCPWCLIGTRHLRSALRVLAQLRPALGTRITWIGQPLLPDLPRAGVDYQEFYLARLGSPTGLAARRAQVKAAGEAAGLRFAFDRIRRMPHTGAAHALLDAARAQGRFDAMLNRQFEGFFLHGEDIGDPAVLACMAREVGVSPTSMLPRTVAAEGGGVVPRFTFNSTMSVEGAVPPERLLRAMLSVL
jgi:predicted DsbA family dithiol-disulfide isomerase